MHSGVSIMICSVPVLLQKQAMHSGVSIVIQCVPVLLQKQAMHSGVSIVILCVPVLLQKQAMHSGVSIVILCVPMLLQKQAMIHYMKTLRPTQNKQGNTTNLNNSFFTEKEKRTAQVGLKPTTYCLLGRCSTTKLPRQLNG